MTTLAPDAYRAFLEAKRPPAPMLGLPCTDADILLDRSDGKPEKAHHRHIVRWAVQGGRRAIFAAFGLGKSTMQLSASRAVLALAFRHGIAPRRAELPHLALIVGPLGARTEMLKDAALLGIDLRFVRSTDEVLALAAEGARHFLTNIETVRDGKIDVDLFTFASLDEAACLRDYGSETYQIFVPMFARVPYRLVATAMPAPNRYKELIHYAAFLGIMDSGQALTRFFQRNSEKAGDLTLYPHKEEEFWLWVSSWACFLQKPSDLGLPDDGYVLPELDVRFHEVKTDIAGTDADDRGQAALFRDAAIGVVQAAREKRSTIDLRVAKAVEIVEASPDDHFILWHDLEDERKAIEAALPEVASVFGKQRIEQNEALADDFAEGRVARLAAKPSMLGAGRNFQYHCHREIFVGVGYKFHDFLQAVHRVWRFMQSKTVVIDLIYAETEAAILRDLLRKWKDHKLLVERMSELIRRYGLNHIDADSGFYRSIGCVRQEAVGDIIETPDGPAPRWRMINNDSVVETAAMPDASVDLIVTSVPFGNQYEYTPSYNDFGHTDDNGHFFAQMDFLTPNLLRILKPGRLACVHVKDRIRFGNVTGKGAPTLDPFSDEVSAHFRRHGFDLMARITVDTDVVRENNQTYRLSYGELLKDSTKMGAGVPEYVLIFRRPQTDRSRGYADTPVSLEPPRCIDFDDPDAEPQPYHRELTPLPGEGYSLARWQVDAHAHWRSSGDRFLTADELAKLPTSLLPKAFKEAQQGTIYDHEEHVRLGELVAGRDPADPRGGLPRTYMSLAPEAVSDQVWSDITRMRTLNNEQSLGNREKHVCPLQIDIVDRLIRLRSMPGELVFDPFAGIGTVPARAVALGRRGLGVELNGDKYYPDAVRYTRAAEDKIAMPTMFALLGADAEAA